MHEFSLAKKDGLKAPPLDHANSTNLLALVEDQFVIGDAGVGSGVTPIVN